MSKLVKLLLAVVVVIVMISAGVYGYIHFVKDDAPAALTSTTSTQTPVAAALPTDLSGTWNVTNGSQAGYRVKEVLFGQSTEGVGRTSGVSGSATLTGTTVSAASFTVDMTSLKSDSDRRDGQVQGRILQTATYPTSTLALTSPIVLPGAPTAAGYTVPAAGTLTLHGVTKAVTLSLNVKATGETVTITGSLPVTFTDYGIDDPSFPGAQVEQNGAMEYSVVLTKA